MADPAPMAAPALTTDPCPAGVCAVAATSRASSSTGDPVRRPRGCAAAAAAPSRFHASSREPPRARVAAGGGLRSAGAVRARRRVADPPWRRSSRPGEPACARAWTSAHRPAQLAAQRQLAVDLHSRLALRRGIEPFVLVAPVSRQPDEGGVVPALAVRVARAPRRAAPPGRRGTARAPRAARECAPVPVLRWALLAVGDRRSRLIERVLLARDLACDAPLARAQPGRPARVARGCGLRRARPARARAVRASPPAAPASRRPMLGLRARVAALALEAPRDLARRLSSPARAAPARARSASALDVRRRRRDSLAFVQRADADRGARRVERLAHSPGERPRADRALAARSGPRRGRAPGGGACRRPTRTPTSAATGSTSRARRARRESSSTGEHDAEQERDTASFETTAPSSRIAHVRNAARPPSPSAGASTAAGRQQQVEQAEQRRAQQAQRDEAEQQQHPERAGRRSAAARRRAARCPRWCGTPPAPRWGRARGRVAALHRTSQQRALRR